MLPRLSVVQGLPFKSLGTITPLKDPEAPLVIHLRKYMAASRALFSFFACFGLASILKHK